MCYLQDHISRRQKIISILPTSKLTMKLCGLQFICDLKLPTSFCHLHIYT